MADVNMTELREPDPIAADKYVDGGKGFVPNPPKGVYTLITTAVEWGSSKDNYLQGTLTHKVQAPGEVYDGHEIRFHRISTKRWPNREGSSMGDYTRGHAVPTIPPNNAGWMALVDGLVGRPFEAGVDWKAYDAATGTDIKGQEAFPDLPSGKKQDFILVGSGEGAVKVYARTEVKFIVSKVGK